MSIDADIEVELALDADREEREVHELAAMRREAGLRCALDRVRFVLGLRRGPIQAELLEAMLEAAEQTGVLHAWSPLEASRLLGVTLGTAAYHVRMLERDGLLVLVAETRVRGAVQHHYTLAPRAVRS